MQPISDGIVEEGRNPEETHGDEIYPLHEHLESQVVTKVYRGEVGNGEDQYRDVSEQFSLVYERRSPKRLIRRGGAGNRKGLRKKKRLIDDPKLPITSTTTRPSGTVSANRG